MKKLLVVLTVALMVVSIFAAEKTFTLGPVTYTGTVYFELAVTKDGVDILGQLKDVKASLAVDPKSDTQAGAKFSISYSTIGAAPTLALESISFTTPYFGAYYSTDKQFVSDYFTGKDYNVTGTPFKDPFKSDFEDSLKLTFPAVAGLEVYYLDKNSERTDSWFSDMLLAKYAVADWTIVGGTYNTGNTDKYEFGAAVNGSISLGVATPTVQAFAGMVQDATEMKMAYDFKLSATYKPVAFLTLAPEVKFAEKLDKLEYRSTNIENGKYVQLGVTYEQTFAPVTLKAQVTPKYDFAAEKTTLKLNELSAKVAVTPVTVFVKTTNDDLLDNTKKYTLYVQGDFAAEQFGLTAKAEWADVTQFENYKYIHVTANANVVKDLTLTGNFRMVTTGEVKQAYNVSASYGLASNVNLSAFFGTLTTNDSGKTWSFLKDPTWNVKLTYKASF
ncbi:hypothetical protein IM41_06360 [Fervidobacterium sp. SC_NGM5_G05]|nr:hypothetical protein IM41_06360 [Fervidobacterium sp. SC_NGM5_G05]